LGLRDGFGVASDPDQPAELVAIVRALLADPAKLAAMGLAARAAASQYARANEIRKFVQILEESKQS
jgi:UDP-N-acetylglucosamine:LPS N-acetylglucosamine transferase